MPRISQFKQTNFKNDDLSSLQNNVNLVLDPVVKSSILDYVLLTDIALVSGKINKVPHKLQRGVVGWHIADKSANVNIWRDPSSPLSDRLFLNLVCSVSCTVNVYIY